MKLLCITDDPLLAADPGCPPSPARLWTNISHTGTASFATMRIDPCLMAGKPTDWATFNRMATASGLIWWQDCFGLWKEPGTPPKLSDTYLRAYRKALQAIKGKTTADNVPLLTDFEGLSTDPTGKLRHDAREEQPWLFAVGHNWAGWTGNYNVVAKGDTINGRNFVWPSVGLNCPITYDNGETPDGLDAVLDLNGPGAHVFVRPDQPNAEQFCTVARRRSAAAVILFAAMDAPADVLAQVRYQTLKLAKAVGV